ncbi:MAG TPA: hypothetical protein VG325_08890 [Solirubrobacteraceae bacterium]|nr:hypothetical protein [Solirubrobacteraceae bacterium]
MLSPEHAHRRGCLGQPRAQVALGHRLQVEARIGGRRRAEPREVKRDHLPVAGQPDDDEAPDLLRGGQSVEQHQRVPAAELLHRQERLPARVS